MNNKTLQAILIVGLIIICLIASLAVLFSFMGTDIKEKLTFIAPQENLAEKQAKEEEQALLDANQDIMEQAEQADYQSIDEINKDDHLLIETSGPVEIILYNDFDGPFFTKIYDTIKQVEEEFSDQVTIAYRHFPLTIYPMSWLAAQAAECAAEQGQFQAIYDKLYELKKDNLMSIEQFEQSASELELDEDQFNQCLAYEKYQEKISQQLQQAKDAGVIGAPAIFINGEHYAGAMPFEDYTTQEGNLMAGMKSVIERHLE